MPLSVLLDWLRGHPPLDSAPYEELVRRYPTERKRVFDEIVRRLSEIVFMAAVDFCRRNGVAVVQERAAELTMLAFESFLPEIKAGQPEMILRRLAGTIRTVLDDEAFHTIERVYYRHLILYHVRSNDQRRCLEAMFASGMVATPQQIATRLLLPSEQVEKFLEAGNREMDRIMENDFEEAELRECTEGCLPVMSRGGRT